jgi:hypothetical protein
MEGESKRKGKKTGPSNLEHDDSSILQPSRFRRGSVLVDSSNWKFVESEFRFVLYSGAILWIIHFISMAV